MRSGTLFAAASGNEVRRDRTPVAKGMARRAFCGTVPPPSRRRQRLRDRRVAGSTAPAPREDTMLCHCLCKLRGRREESESPHQLSLRAKRGAAERSAAIPRMTAAWLQFLIAPPKPEMMPGACQQPSSTPEPVTPLRSPRRHRCRDASSRRHQVVPLPLRAERRRRRSPAAALSPGRGRSGFPAGNQAAPKEIDLERLRGALEVNPLVAANTWPLGWAIVQLHRR